MTVSFKAKGKVTISLYVKLVESDWSINLLMEKSGPGIQLLRTSNGLQVMDHMRDINAPTEHGQHLADLLSPVKQIKYIHVNPSGNFIQIDFEAKYTEGEEIADALENAKEIIQEFNRELRSDLVIST